jgi:hypothetical protein
MWDKRKVDETLLLKAQYAFKVTICALYNLKTMFQMYAVSVMHVRQKKA